MKSLSDAEVRTAKANTQIILRALKTRPRKTARPGDKIEALRFQAANALILLRQMAKTNPAALECLANELDSCIRCLNKDALRNPEHYRKLATRCARWPSVVGPDRDLIEDNAVLLDRLQVGTRATVNFSKGKKQWTRRTPEIRIALRLIETLKRLKPDLPPLELGMSTTTLWLQNSITFEFFRR